MWTCSNLQLPKSTIYTRQAFFDAFSQHQGREALVSPGAGLKTEAESALLIDIEGTGQPHEGREGDDSRIARAGFGARSDGSLLA